MIASDAFRQRWLQRRMPAMISVHRGLWGPAPENSLAAIAGASGYDIIEIDTQIASDGVPVVIHDPDLSRTAGLSIRPCDVEYATLTQQFLYEGSGGPNAKLTSERLPTLSDGVAAASPNCYFDIDVKLPEEVEAIAKFLADSKLQHKGSLKIDTKTSEDIEKLLHLQRQYDVMVMAKVVLPDAGLGHIRELAEAGVAAAELWFDDLSQLRQACDIAAKRMAISTFTLDPVHCCGLSDTRALADPELVWGQLLNAGVSIIMTDLAPNLEAYMRSTN